MKTLLRCAIATIVAVAGSLPALSQEVAYFRTTTVTALLGWDYRPKSLLPVGTIVVGYRVAEGALMQVDGLRTGEGDNGWIVAHELERVVPELGPTGLPVAGACSRSEPVCVLDWGTSRRAAFRFEEAPEIRLAIEPAAPEPATVFLAADGTRLVLDYQAGQRCSASSVENTIRSGGMLTVTWANGEQEVHGVCCHASVAAF